MMYWRELLFHKINNIKDMETKTDNVHDQFSQVIKELSFKKDWSNEYDYLLNTGIWFYHLDFEGYAYVLYQTINIYVPPLMNLFRLYNKFAKGEAQICLHYQVPIAHFREPEKLRTIMAILTEKLEGDE